MLAAMMNFCHTTHCKYYPVIIAKHKAIIAPEAPIIIQTLVLPIPHNRHQCAIPVCSVCCCFTLCLTHTLKNKEFPHLCTFYIYFIISINFPNDLTHTGLLQILCLRYSAATYGPYLKFLFVC